MKPGLRKAEEQTFVIYWLPVQIRKWWIWFSRGARNLMEGGAGKEISAVRDAAGGEVVWGQQSLSPVCFCPSSFLKYFWALMSRYCLLSSGNVSGFFEGVFPSPVLLWLYVKDSCSTFAYSHLWRIVSRASLEQDTKNCRHFMELSNFKITIAICINFCVITLIHFQAPQGNVLRHVT